ncbi:MAG TPA: cytochrome P450 [Thermoanaerobaculia bacterium]|nr:cytochrome P450 [Thermoanaerobaculia bacterium]
MPRGPKGHFLLGSLPDLGRDILGFFESCGRGGYGDLVAFRLAHRPAFFLNHPSLIEPVLVGNARNFIKHTFFWRHVSAIFGKGLLTSEGDFWLRQRRLAAPAFHRDRIARYADVMVAYTDRMLDGWKAGEERDIHHEMMRVTMQIVTRTLFNVEVGDETERVGRAFDVALEEIFVRLRRPFLIPDWVPIPSNNRYRRTVAELDSLVYRIIAERRRNEGDQGDLLSMLLEVQDEDGTRMTDRQVRDETITLFLAGHETTAITLSWTWLLLGQHPEAERRLHEEIDRVLNGRVPTAADYERLPFARNVITESMRLFPPAYAFGREALGECQIGGATIPKGATLYASPWVMHRDPRWFDDPESFRPERWEGDFSKKLPRFAYFPFGGGPRICIGNGFAMMEAVLLLASIAQRFRLRLVPGQKIEPFASITLRPQPGIRVTLEAR